MQVGDESDKHILTHIYCSTGGPHWTTKQHNWLSPNLQQWEGVDLDGDNVSSLDLCNFFISGMLICNTVGIYNIMKYRRQPSQRNSIFKQLDFFGRFI